jgi:hypothetical protein
MLALVAFAGAVVSDVTDDSFWGHHSLLASLVSSVIVVMLSVAVVNEILERRRRRRWSILAQYVMFDLIRNARMIWLGILEVTGLFAVTQHQQDSIDGGALVIRDSPRLTAALRASIADSGTYAELQSEVAFLSDQSEEVLGRWAAVMLDADAYASVLDRHVELAGNIGWIASLLDSWNPPSDVRRQRRAHSSPSTQIQAEQNGEWLADRLVVIAQLAEVLDRETLELALRVVPGQWWEARLGTLED